MIALVLAVTADGIFSGSMLHVPSSGSTGTGTAPICVTASQVAIKVLEGTRTSSFGPRQGLSRPPTVHQVRIRHQSRVVLRNRKRTPSRSVRLPRQECTNPNPAPSAQLCRFRPAIRRKLRADRQKEPSSLPTSHIFLEGGIVANVVILVVGFGGKYKANRIAGEIVQIAPDSGVTWTPRSGLSRTKLRERTPSSSTSSKLPDIAMNN